MDIRKVISPLNAPTFSATTLKVPEGDRPVYYTKTGFLDSEHPLICSSVSFTNGITTAAGSQAVSNNQILRGNYFGTTGTFTASDLDPRRDKIIASGVSGTNTMSFPTPTVHIAYLKQMYGPENILPGLKWKIQFINDTGGSGNLWVLSFPQTQTCYGFGSTGSATYDLKLDGGDGNSKNSGSIEFLITNVKPGSEAITYFAGH